MTQQHFFDPKIRDNVFLPMVVLMFLVNLLRFYFTKVLNTQSNSLTDNASMSHRNLKGTMLEHKADISKEHWQSEGDLDKCLKKIKDDVKFGRAMMRSTRIRQNANYLPENAVKQRKAYFCTNETGYLNQKVKYNQMAQLQNPDMMKNMMKGNVQSVLNMVIFQGIGSVFSGFIIAQFPFPLGQKFKTLTQQGVRLLNLDPSFVSSMSW